MTRRLLSLALLSGLFTLAACGAAPDSEPGDGTDAIGTTQEMVEAGCHTVCPKCPPNQVCPLSPCYLECNKPAQCTETQMCIQGYTWSQSACACVPSKH